MKIFMHSIKKIYSIMLSIIILICLIFQHIEYAREKEYFINNFLALPLGIILVLIIYFLVKRIVNKENIKNEKKILIVASISLFVIQVFCVLNYYFYTDWDVKTIIDSAYAIANGDIDNVATGYFSMYPNNLLLLFLFSKIIEICNIVGLKACSYELILIFQCFLYMCVGIITFFIIKKLLKSSRLAWFGWILYILTLGISPWVSIPYSDSIGVIFPVLILLLYCYIPSSSIKRIIIKYLVIGSCTIIAYQIKPQTSIVTIAILIIEIFSINRARWKKYMAGMLAFVVGGALALGICSAACKSLEIPLDKERSHGITHFLMLGANYQAMGVWNQEDIDISNSCQSVEEREKVNLTEFFNRVSSMGIDGVLKLIVRKTLTNFNDGTFCWGGEGTFYYNILPEKNNLGSRLLRNLYYNRNISPYYIYYEYFAQIIWMGVLSLSIVAGLYKDNKIQIVIMLALIGLTIFETIFEARARYLITYVPFFIIMVSMGITVIDEKIQIKHRVC